MLYMKNINTFFFFFWGGGGGEKGSILELCSMEWKEKIQLADLGFMSPVNIIKVMLGHQFT